MYRTVLVAVMLVLTGCGAVPGGPPDTTPRANDVGAAASDPGDATAAATDTDATNAADLTDADGAADRLDEFEHLNVTVTGVAFERTDGRSVEFDIDAQTVDLVRLDGENATLVDSNRVPEDTYIGVAIRVDGVTGTLETGETVDVRLPGGQLRIEEPFTVEDGTPIAFAFDVTVVATDGGYVLAPAVGGSGGSDARPIDRTLTVDRTATGTDGTASGSAAGDDGDGDAVADRHGTIGRGGAADRTDGAETGDVDIEFDGGTSPGGILLVTVTRGGAPVVGATVEVGGETRRTNRYGTATIEVPDDARVLTVAVEHDGERAKLVREYADHGGADG